MKCLGRKTVIEYTYENEKEAEEHEKTMRNQGWNVESRKGFFTPDNYRGYSKRQREGAYL